MSKQIFWEEMNVGLEALLDAAYDRQNVVLSIIEGAEKLNNAELLKAAVTEAKRVQGAINDLRHRLACVADQM